MIRDRVLSLWGRPSNGNSKEALASGIACCPSCGTETRLLLFKAKTKRRPTSPDCVGYEVEGHKKANALTHEAPSEPPNSDGGDQS